MKKYKNIKCKHDLTRDNCTYYPEFKATCPDNCPNRRKDSKGQSVSDDYIIRLEQENLRDKEALKVLAEAVKDNYYESDPDGPDFCRYCDGNLSRRNVATVHKEDCPVLLAEEILNDN